MRGENVLLVEDNHIDARLFEQALKLARPGAALHRVEDVLSAVYYLRGIGFYADRAAHPLPYLLVIDLNLASVNGMELLKWIQKDPELNHRMLTLILTGSEDLRDGISAYTNGATAYLRKLRDRAALAESLAKLHETWRTLHLLPDTG
jgi:CheY-like chemotaxis protein